MARARGQAPIIRTCITALIFGGILPLALAPWGWWFIGILSVAGLSMMLKNMSGWGCFWRSFWYGMGMFGSGASWVYYSIHDFGNASPALAFGLTLLFVIFLASIFALPMALYSAFNRHPVNAILALPSLWVMTEWLRGWIFTGFPWLYLGNGFIDTPLAGWAPIAGVMALSWIAVFSAAILALIPDWTKHRRALENRLIFVSLVWLGGWFLMTVNWTTPQTNSLSVGTIQPAVPLTTKWDPSKLEQVLSQHKDLTQQVNDMDIVIWPESAIPKFQHEVTDFLQSVSLDATQNRTSLIIGIPTQNLRTGQYYNSVIGLGLADGRYDKQHLVPFGEYVPFEELLRGTIDFFDLPMSSFSSGRSNQPLISSNGIKIATAICYEITFPQLVSDLASNANLLLTVSNDSWFGDSIGPQQHFEMARMRALENGKPLIRSTNDGISAIVDHQGKVLVEVPRFHQTVLTGSVTPRDGTTPFNRWGSYVILPFSLLMLLMSTQKIESTPTRKKRSR